MNEWVFGVNLLILVLRESVALSVLYELYANTAALKVYASTIPQNLNALQWS